MPLWNVYHPVGAYTPEDKAAFAGRITDLYDSFLPRFYVGVLFHEVAKDSFFMGAEGRDNFVRIRADQFARHVSSPERMDQWMKWVNDAIEPFVKDRGYDWEVHIDETPRALWTIQGMKPPESNSDGEKKWKEANRPVPYEA